MSHQGKWKYLVGWDYTPEDMDQAGKNGWELCAAVQRNVFTVTYWKRHIDDRDDREGLVGPGYHVFAKPVYYHDTLGSECAHCGIRSSTLDDVSPISCYEEQKYRRDREERRHRDES